MNAEFIPEALHLDESNPFALSQELGRLFNLINKRTKYAHVLEISHFLKEYGCGENDVDCLTINLDRSPWSSDKHVSHIVCDGLEEDQIETFFDIFSDLMRSGNQETIEKLIHSFPQGLSSADSEDIIKLVFDPEDIAERESLLLSRNNTTLINEQANIKPPPVL